jgi:hypothetical protein
MFRQILRSLLSLVFAMGVFGVGVAHAAVLETSDVMERQLVSTPSNHSICCRFNNIATFACNIDAFTTHAFCAKSLE